VAAVPSLSSLTGLEFESLLESHLVSRGLAFHSEHSLRLAGKASKTPDFLLAAPILVHGHVVNWIDSKAHFASPGLKREQIEGQLRQYVNRSGSGMVIYWLDFVEGEEGSASTPLPPHCLSTSAASARQTTNFAAPALDEEGKILLLTDFPSEFTSDAPAHASTSMQSQKPSLQPSMAQKQADTTSSSTTSSSSSPIAL
jgi:hypothetical protein